MEVMVHSPWQLFTQISEQSDNLRWHHHLPLFNSIETNGEIVWLCWVRCWPMNTGRSQVCFMTTFPNQKMQNIPVKFLAENQLKTLKLNKYYWTELCRDLGLHLWRAWFVFARYSAILSPCCEEKHTQKHTYISAMWFKSLRKVALAGYISMASMWGVTAGWRVALNPIGF